MIWKAAEDGEGGAGCGGYLMSGHHHFMDTVKREVSPVEAGCLGMELGQ